MSMKLMVEAMSVKVGNSGRKLVLLKLADHANDKCECWPSYQHIADACEMGRSTVKAHIKQLVSEGFLKMSARNDGKSSNMYILTLKNGDCTRSESDPVKNQPGQESAPTRSESAPPTRSESDPRTSHSFEPVNEPVCTVHPLREQTAFDKINFLRWPDGPDEQFELLWPFYPKRTGSNPKRAALNAWRARIRAGENPKTMGAGLIRYIRFLDATGDLGTKYVMQASRFFGPGQEYTNPWALPAGQDEESAIQRMTDREWATG